MSENIVKLIEEIKNLKVLELAELVKALEEEFGVSATPVAVAAGPATTETAVDAQTEFTVMLTSAGDKKIEVIKVVREITGLGLKEAKEVVDNAPRAVKENASKEDADAIVEKLKAAGAGVELK